MEAWGQYMVFPTGVGMVRPSSRRATGVMGFPHKSGDGSGVIFVGLRLWVP